MTATVKIDGEWYVSGFYTLADYALKDAGAPWPTTSTPLRGSRRLEDPQPAHVATFEHMCEGYDDRQPNPKVGAKWELISLRRAKR